MKTATKKIIAGIFGILLLSTTANAVITDALKVKISNGSATDETVIRFISGATPSFDGSFDAYKMFSSSPTVPAAFTAIDPANKLSINAMPTLNAFTDVEVFFHIKVAGTYTLQAIELGAFLPNTKITLEDKQDGTFYSFKNGTSVTLPMSVNTVNSASRFVIHFRPAPVAAVTSSRFEGAVARSAEADEEPEAVTEVETPSLKTYMQDGNIVLNAELKELSSVTIMIYSISGQQVYSYSSKADGSFNETAPIAASGIYIIHSIINNKANSQKIQIVK